ncbi:MAG TPA: hypothetical protein VFH89_08070, partial [Sphingomicrobium sp.]|nr:hypothetical protein [Sphingomicrobium sp.]
TKEFRHRDFPTCSEPIVSRLAEPLVRSPVIAALTPPDYGLLQGHGYQNGKDLVRFGVIFRDIRR